MKAQRDRGKRLSLPAWLPDRLPGYMDRAPGLPLLGWVVGGSVSVLLWTALSLSAWALLVR